MAEIDPETTWRLFREAANRGEEWMNSVLTVRRLSGDDAFSVRKEAARLGGCCADENWIRTASVEENLRLLGIKKVRDMSIMEEQAWRARALYDPSGAKILLNRSRIEEMGEIQKALGNVYLDTHMIETRLLLHECFHHLEISRDMRLSQTLCPGKRLPEEISDIAANAFANSICGKPLCQEIDILWMAVYAPGRLKSCLAKGVSPADTGIHPAVPGDSTLAADEEAGNK